MDSKKAAENQLLNFAATNRVSRPITTTKPWKFKAFDSPERLTRVAAQRRTD